MTSRKRRLSKKNTTLSQYYEGVSEHKAQQVKHNATVSKILLLRPIARKVSGLNR